MIKLVNKCDECEKLDAMEHQDNGSTEYHDEWLECKYCGFTRELTEEEIDHDLEMRFGI